MNKFRINTNEFRVNMIVFHIYIYQYVISIYFYKEYIDMTPFRRIRKTPIGD